MVSARMNVIEFASIIGSDPKKQPYNNQHSTPVVKIAYILKEIPLVSCVLTI
jgi:hypothetical protein